MAVNESVVTINDKLLTEAQSMTIRVALQTFAMSLQADGLGQDETGKGICAGYLSRIQEINDIMRHGRY